MPKQTRLTLGEFLRKARNKAGLSLRDVEEETNVSNAYLSQLESEKIKQPSPVVLHKLSKLYGVAYAGIMELAGYPVPKPLAGNSMLHARVGRLTEDEEDAVVDFVELLRSRRRRQGRQ
ncbi:MAG TPA: helix-turn-helix transcriptional regulator [Pyrinomonadaceae bacterium]|nr:helix-turn-helix transcriptional regulator [Pyrinomonadaceae bacterium]